MDSAVVQVLLVMAVVVAAIGIGRAADRRQRPTHPPVDLSGLDVPPGVVVFTSTQCDNCKRVMARLREIGAPVREVTHELEPQLFESAAVGAVPLAVVTDPQGIVVAQLAGAVSRRAVRRAVVKAGWAADAAS